MINRLVKTTPYIGGQIRLDLIVNRHEDGLSYVDDIHVVPVSDNIVFNESNSWATLNYSHTDNIKHLYSIIGNDMFTAPNKYNTYKWLYNDTHSKMDTYDLTYYMGMKRMRYDRYGKQFSYFCPMWIYPQKDERFLLDDSMRFELDVYNVTADFRNSIYNVRFTDKTLKYLNDYLSILDDKLLNINFDQYTAYIDGIYTPSGTHLNKDVKYLLTNMLTHERPLMEFDYLIADTFIQNRLIAKQLVNFNFVFNIEDILPPEHNEYMFRDMTVVCKCFAYGEEVAVKDIYSNYDFIPAYTITSNPDVPEEKHGTYDDDYNVLDYKHDYLCKELVYANKESQPIIHWTLESNPTYTFNMYNGFSPINVDDPSHPLINGKYFDQPDTTYTEYDPYMCNLMWCAVKDLRYSTNIGSEIYTITDYTEFPPSNVDASTVAVYINNIKYNIGKIYGELPDRDTPYKFVIVIIPENSIDEGPVMFGDDMVAFKVEPGHLSALAFANLPQTLDGYLADPTYEDYIEPLTILRKLVGVYEKPWKIRFEDTVTPYYTQGPKANDVSSREIDFYNDRCAVEIYRYSDSMMPQLMDPWEEETPIEDSDILDVSNSQSKQAIDTSHKTANIYNFIYRHIQWADNEQYEDTGDMTTAEYNRLLNTGYLPFYPSIGYYSLIGEKLAVDTVPEFYDDNFIEQFWFDRNRVFNLFYEVVVTDTLPVTDTNNDEIIEVFWKHLYNTIWDDGEYAPYKMNFLKDRYKYAIKFEYASLSDVSNYDFVVTFTLK